MDAMHEPLLDSEGEGKPNKSPVYYNCDRATRSISGKGASSGKSEEGRMKSEEEQGSFFREEW
ncbi:hypothetical protein CKA32_005889 [Geitlerinema sp. FC II]|nr:hypothetical protein CKA32_005889 [Geitlerinema sp. FC II]